MQSITFQHFFSAEELVACPYFVPVEKLENGNWLHARRLPLGCGWSGQCSAPGHEGETPSQEELREFCNLGYAEGCGRLPREREWDSVRFAARTAGGAHNGTEARIHVRYVCEREHRPAGHGTLEFDAYESRWVERHRDDRVQRMAECFLQSFLENRKKQEVTRAAAG
ncbi:MAG: hypothetical protein ABSF72_16690 [Candidatus Sulfotelmatobacter sp.]|jgi:hypothetical protein